MPRVAGIFSNKADLDTYLQANSTAGGFVIPASNYSPQLTFTYDEVPLLLIGSIVSSPTTGQYIKGQDGNYYTINEVYQVIGVNEIVQLDMTQEYNYVISSSFTTATNNTKVYYQYTSSSGNATWNTFTIHA